MKTIKIIDLLNKIANGEEVPENIKYDTKSMKYDHNKQDYLGYYSNGNGNWLFQYLFDRCRNTNHFINDEVEILDEEEFEDIESFGIHYSWDYIDYKNIEELKKYVNEDFQNIFDTLDKLIKNQKKIIEKLNKNNNNQ